MVYLTQASPSQSRYNPVLQKRRKASGGRRHASILPGALTACLPVRACGGRMMRCCPSPPARGGGRGGDWEKVVGSGGGESNVFARVWEGLPRPWLFRAAHRAPAAGLIGAAGGLPGSTRPAATASLRLGGSLPLADLLSAVGWVWGQAGRLRRARANPGFSSASLWSLLLPAEAPDRPTD